MQVTGAPMGLRSQVDVTFGTWKAGPNGRRLWLGCLLPGGAHANPARVHRLVHPVRALLAGRNSCSASVAACLAVGVAVQAHRPIGQCRFCAAQRRVVLARAGSGVPFLSSRILREQPSDSSKSSGMRKEPIRAWMGSF